MRRYFYIADNLDVLENVQQSLKDKGYSEYQYYVLSRDDLHVEQHKLHDVASIFKQDVIHSAELGAILGVLSAVGILSLAWLTGWFALSLGWAPFVALAVLALCFCTWEGAFLGIQIPNAKFKGFSDTLDKGKHVFFVDLDQTHEREFKRLMKGFPQLKGAGSGSATPAWFIKSQDNIHQLVKALP